MSWPRTRRCRLSLALMGIGFLILAAACTGDPEPTATPTPTPSATPTPTPTAELTVDELVSSAGQRLAGLSSAQFDVVDESQSGAEFFGTTFKSMEAEVASPDSFRMLVSVVGSGPGIREDRDAGGRRPGVHEVLGRRAVDPPARRPVPFDFRGVGVTLSEVVSNMQDPAIAGREDVMGTPTIRIDGSIVSEDLSNLITGANPGHAITLTVWIDEVDHTLRRMRIAGRLYDDDAPETKRLLNFSIDVPVDIQLPDLASGP